MGGSWSYMASIEANTWEGNLQAKQAAAEAAYNAERQVEATQEVAERLRKNGYTLEALRKDVQKTNEILESGLTRLSSITQDGFASLAAKMDVQQATLDSMDLTLQNPKAAQARELFRRGIQTIQLGLFDEAVEVFQEALSIDKLQPILHLALATALNARGDRSEALVHTDFAYRYSGVKSPLSINGELVDPNRIRAAAAIMAADLALDEGEEESAMTMLKEVVEQNERYGEVNYTLALLAAKRGEDEVYSRALRLAIREAPENAVRAYRAGLPRAEEIAESLAQTELTFSAMRNVIRSVEALKEKKGRSELNPALYDDTAILMGSYPALEEKYLSRSVKQQVDSRRDFLAVRPVIDSAREASLREQYDMARKHHEADLERSRQFILPEPGRLASKKTRQAYEESLARYETLTRPSRDRMVAAEQELSAFLTAHDARVAEWNEAQADRQLVEQLATDISLARPVRMAPFTLMNFPS